MGGTYSHGFLAPTRPLPQSQEAANHQLFDACIVGDVNFVEAVLIPDSTTPQRRARYFRASGNTSTDSNLLEPQFFPEIECIENREENHHKGYKPLHYACYHGHASIVSVILRAGADVYAKTTENESALDVAMLHDRGEVVKVLISEGQVAMDNDDELIGSTITNLAADSLSMLITHGGVKTTGAMLHDLFKKWENMTPRQQETRNKAFIAMLRAMLSGGADPNFTDGDFQSSLHWIAKEWRNDSPIHKFYKRCIQVLIQNNADVNHAGGDQCNSALHFACRLGHSRACAALLALPNCDATARNIARQTPLHMALRRKHGRVEPAHVLACVKLLLRAGCDPNALSSLGYRPIGLAMGKHLGNWDPLMHRELVKSLIDAGGKTQGEHLHEAFAARQAKLLGILIQGGAQIDAIDAAGHSLLDKLAMIWWSRGAGSGSRLTPSSSSDSSGQTGRRRMRSSSLRQSLDGGRRPMQQSLPRRSFDAGTTDDAAFMVECTRIVISAGADIEAYIRDRGVHVPSDFAQYLRGVQRDVTSERSWRPKFSSEEAGPWWTRLASLTTSRPWILHGSSGDQRLFDLVADAYDVGSENEEEEEQVVTSTSDSLQSRLTNLENRLNRPIPALEGDSIDAIRQHNEALVAEITELRRMASDIVSSGRAMIGEGRLSVDTGTSGA